MEWLATGTLVAQPAIRHPELLAPPVVQALDLLGPEWAEQIGVAATDPALADTADFCARYGVGLEVSANCVVGSGIRGASCSCLDQHWRRCPTPK